MSAEEPYPGLPRYAGDWLDKYLDRAWGWSTPTIQYRYLEKPWYEMTKEDWEVLRVRVANK